jgi:hypothetical protein
MPAFHAGMIYSASIQIDGVLFTPTKLTLAKRRRKRYQGSRTAANLTSLKH